MAKPTKYITQSGKVRYRVDPIYKGKRLEKSIDVIGRDSAMQNNFTTGVLQKVREARQ